MIRTSITLDLTRRDTDTTARRRRIFTALGSVEPGTLVRLTISHDAYFDDTVSLIAGLTLDCDVEITGTDPRRVRQYASLLHAFQAQRRGADPGGCR